MMSALFSTLAPRAAPVTRSLPALLGAPSRLVASATPPPTPGTADLCDVFHPENVDVVSDNNTVSILQPSITRLLDLGGRKKFHGQVSTVRCFENNPLVRKALGEKGLGRVLVVDGGGSQRCVPPQQPSISLSLS